MSLLLITVAICTGFATGVLAIVKVCVASLSVLVVRTRVVLRLYTVCDSARLAVMVSTMTMLAPVPRVVVMSTTDVKLVIEVTVVVDQTSKTSMH